MPKLLAVCILPLFLLGACSGAPPSASSATPTGSEVALPTTRQVGLSGH